MNKLSSQYMAGFLDADGGIYIYEREKLNPNIHIEVCNTNKEVIYAFKKTLSYGRIMRIEKNDGKAKKPLYRWRLFHRVHAKDFLKRVIPYLVVKKQRAKNGLKIIENYKYKKSYVKDINPRIIKNYHKHFSIREISRILGISIGSVHAKLHES